MRVCMLTVALGNELIIEYQSPQLDGLTEWGILGSGRTYVIPLVLSYIGDAFIYDTINRRILKPSFQQIDGKVHPQG